MLRYPKSSEEEFEVVSAASQSLFMIEKTLYLSAEVKGMDESLADDIGKYTFYIHFDQSTNSSLSLEKSASLLRSRRQHSVA